MSQDKKQYKVYITKKPFSRFEKALEERYGDMISPFDSEKSLASDIADLFCQTFNYDPMMSTYDQAQHLRIKARRAKLKQGA